MTAPRTVTVIGGGVVGSAIALRLQAAGFDVALIDRGDPRRGASYGNIGHIAAEQCEPTPSPAMLRGAFGRLFGFGGPLDFRLSDISQWAPWAIRFVAASRPAQVKHNAVTLSALLAEPLEAWARLLTVAGAPQEMVRSSGHAVVWTSPEAVRKGHQAWRAARTGSASFRPMEASELAAYEGPLTRRPCGGILFSGTGQVSEPHRVRDKLVDAFVLRGGSRIQAEASSLRVVGGRTEARMADGSTIDSDRTVIAAGAWSAPLMASLGVRVPIIGERGYSVQSQDHAWPTDLPLTVFEDRALVLARFTGGLRASSYVEFGDPSAPPDPRKWRRIEAQLKMMGIDFSETPDRWSGPRPTLPDYLPAIGQLAANPSVLYAFGHQHLGLTLAAKTSELVEDLVSGRPPPYWLRSLRIERFSDGFL